MKRRSLASKRGRKWRARFSKKVALHEVTARTSQGISLLGRFDSFGGHNNVEFLAHSNNGFDHGLLGCLAMNVAYKRHVQFYHVRLQECEAGEAGVTRAK